MAIYGITITLVIIFSGIVDYVRNNDLNFKNNSNKLIPYYFLLLTFLVLILVAGLRWRVGTDYWNYEGSYNIYVQNWWDSVVNFNEPGINIIAVVASHIYNDSATMFFISSLITVGLSVWTIYKNSAYFSVSLLLYIFIGAWHGSFNGVRQYLACAVLFIGHKYIIERKFWKYLLIVLLAATFHISALAMIALYFIPIRQLRKRDFLLIIILIVLGLTVYDSMIEIINNVLIGNGRNPLEMDNAYLNQQVSILRVLVMVAPTVLYLSIGVDKVLTKEDYFYINMLFVNAAIYIITMNSAYLARFTLYTNIYIALGFPRIFKGVDKKLSVIIIYIALILYMAFWSYEIMITNNLRNFQWIFER